MKKKIKKRGFASSAEELIQIIERLNSQFEKGKNPEFSDPIKSLVEAINKISRSFSGSWLGYHANVYYENFNLPPHGHHFNQEWGLNKNFSNRASSAYREYNFEEVKLAAYKIASNPNLEPARKLAQESLPLFEDCKSDTLSILAIELSIASDNFLETIKKEVQDLKFHSRREIIESFKPQIAVVTRDTLARNQGYKAPPHIRIKAELTELHNSTALLIELANLIKKAELHLSRKQKPMNQKEPTKLGFEELLHPLIMEHCYQLFEDGHYRDAVLNSVIAIFDYIRERSKSEIDGERLISHVFSLDNPILILSELQSESGKNDQKGFMQIFKGVYQGVRNPKAHSLTNDLTPMKAAQYLIFSSLLARRVEEAKINV